MSERPTGNTPNTTPIAPVRRAKAIVPERRYDRYGGMRLMAGEGERDAVLRALANGLAMLLGTDLAGEPPDATISVRRVTPAAVVRLER